MRMIATQRASTTGTSTNISISGSNGNNTRHRAATVITTTAAAAAAAAAVIVQVQGVYAVVPEAAPVSALTGVEEFNPRPDLPLVLRIDLEQHRWSEPAVSWVVGALTQHDLERPIPVKYNMGGGVG
jgi:hypothetical protein